MMTLARMIGMDIPEINLIDLDAVSGLPEGIGRLEGQALAVRRFNRTPEGPVHTEDFAQVFGVMFVPSPVVGAPGGAPACPTAHRI